MRAERRGFVAVCTLSVVASCSLPGLPNAIGSYSDVTILADRERAGVGELRAALGRPVTVAGEPEPLFVVETLFQVDARTRYARTLVIVCDLDGATSAAASARRLLGPARCDRVRARGAGRFDFADAEARGQRVFVLAGSGGSAADSLARAETDALRDAIEASAFERCRADLLAADSGAERSIELRRAHGFALQAPATYRTQPVSSAWTNAVELVRRSPTRVLTVFWVEEADSTRVRDPAFAIALQRDAAWRLHRDTLVEDRTRVEAVRFGPYAALRLQGVWQNAGEVAGGPLVAYIVHDAGRRRLYGVQCQLYAPGMPKRGWMRELEALASTFRIEGGG